MDLTDGLVFNKNPTAHIRFARFDSRRFGLFLASRAAPTPPEREVVATIPYRQGVVDFSRLSGARIYENREIIYTFYQFGVPQGMAGTYQTRAENLLMREFEQELHDSYDDHFHYLGKCSGIEVEEEYTFRRLKLTITFNLYPFKICNYYEGEAAWDTHNIYMERIPQVEFSVTGNQQIVLENVGQNIAKPVVIASDPFTVTAAGASYEFPIGTTENHRLRLALGENVLELAGTGTIKFLWRTELI